MKTDLSTSPIVLSNSKIRKPKEYGIPVVYLFRTYQKRFSKSGKLSYVGRTIIRFYKEASNMLNLSSETYVNILIFNDSIGIKIVTDKKHAYKVSEYTIHHTSKVTVEYKYHKITVGKLFENINIPNGKYKLIKEKDYYKFVPLSLNTGNIKITNECKTCKHLLALSGGELDRWECEIDRELQLHNIGLYFATCIGPFKIPCIISDCPHYTPLIKTETT